MLPTIRFSRLASALVVAALATAACHDGPQAPTVAAGPGGSTLPMIVDLEGPRQAQVGDRVTFRIAGTDDDPLPVNVDRPASTPPSVALEAFTWEYEASAFTDVQATAHGFTATVAAPGVYRVGARSASFRAEAELAVQ
ncbi:MAG: hypothetical protein NW201_01820 [Gemmatimonadales bacterium]|nr:hypothetical protein [Gemmatimonadales bacterium]